MNLQDIRKKTEIELKEQLVTLYNEMRDLNKNVFEKKEKNHSRLKYLRRNIAQIKTVINEQKVTKK